VLWHHPRLRHCDPADTHRQRRAGGCARGPGAGRGSCRQHAAPATTARRGQGAVAHDPNNSTATLQLANAYFDAEQFTKSIEWYERTVKLDPKNVDANTDLGVSYYYVNRTAEALSTFERSLAMDSKHTKTLLNKGIVLAFGKEDLKAAAAEWQKVVDLAPGSPEGEAARRALEGIAAAAKQHEATATKP
jgi:cytochrome c-type biogenesis protein CcmH/NrfG